MNPTHDPAILKRIAMASMRPCPPIRTSTVWVIERTGMEVSTGGACPMEPFRTETRGFVYMDPVNGCTYGERLPTEHRARHRWHYRQLRQAVQFLRDLRAMSAKDIQSQREYWLKEPPSRKLPGFKAA